MSDPDRLINEFYDAALAEGTDPSPGRQHVLLKEAEATGLHGTTQMLEIQEKEE
jgi:hypothetical protein